ncbi:hypothetical protein A616_18120 [Brevibacillus brevis X23]|nr:hypothetical protein A616_18120 [Brevibacillus brevis X23]
MFSGTSYVRKDENANFFPKHWSTDDVMTAISLHKEKWNRNDTKMGR